MDQYQVLGDYFAKYFPLSHDDKELLKKLFQPRRLARRQFLFENGQVHNYNNFVVSGALRLFLMDERFKEYNLQFAFENWWIGDLGSFLANRPSSLYLQALENTQLLQISSDNQEVLMQDIRFCQLFRRKVERALIRTNQRLLNHLAAPARSRFQDFMETYPQFYNRIPDAQIASYIGVTPEFFCKLKQEYFLES